MLLRKLWLLYDLAVAAQGRSIRGPKGSDSRVNICRDWLCNCLNIKYVEIIVSTLSRCRYASL